VGQFLTLPLGPLIGGWLLNNFHWTSIFWINLPFALLGLLMMAFFIPESRDPGARRLDVPGTVLAVAGVFSLATGSFEDPSMAGPTLGCS
jgi:MFS transporter, DHA2 family, multidrug resistance protein